MKVYFDESGNSGQNLLDPVQPIYVLISHNFTIEESSNILESLNTNSNEIHFKSLKKSYKHYNSIKDILNNSSINYNRIKIAYTNKKYAICAQLIDVLVETVFNKSGLEVNKEGLNILYAQSLYLQAEIFESKENYTELLCRFQKMIRLKDNISVKEFYNKANEIFNSIPEIEEFNKNFLFPILLSENYIDEILESINKYSIDLALPFLTLLSDIWYKNEKTRIDIIHDDSKQIKFWKEFIEYNSDSTRFEKIELGFDDRKMIFPLQINSVNLVDSKDNIQIQLADLIGSAFSYYAKKILLGEDKEDQLAKIISDTRLAKLLVHPLQPDLSFFKKDFKEDKDINPLDFLATEAMKDLNDFNKLYPK